MFFTCSITTDLIGIVGTLIIVIIAYFKWTYSYWKNKGVVTPSLSIPFGNTGDFFTRKSCLGELFRDIYDEFRQKELPYGGFYFINQKFFMPTDLELIKAILQTDFQHFDNRGLYCDAEADPLTGHLALLGGEKWKNLRAKLTPTYTSGKMKMMFQTVADCATGLKDAVEKKSSSAVDIKEISACYTTDIIASTGFGLECNSLKNPEAEFRKFGRLIFTSSFLELMKELVHFFVPKWLLKLIKYKLTNPEVEKFFMDTVQKTVEYREKNNIYRKDFMHLLLQLKNMGKVTDDENITVDGKTSEKALTIKEMAAQVFIFFSAGFETSSTTMTFALYEIALNQEIQRKLREEINRILEKHDNQITYDAIMEMTYMEKVINETLRKYPPFPALNRECTQDYKVPNSNLTIEKGVQILIPTYGIHYDNEYYPNPTVFDTERFDEKNKSSRPPFSWLPFGEGPRMCLGLRFGIIQSKVGLANLVKNFEITLNKKTPSLLKFNINEFVLTSKSGIWLNMKKIIITENRK